MLFYAKWKEDATTDDYYNYHFDNRGSTAALSDEAGTITDRYNYGPYGGIILQSGTTDNSFLYVEQYGVVTDANGLYQMRARYYNPEIKTFINEDDLIGSVENSQSLNRYAYANENHILYVDPKGHFAFAIPVAIGAYELGSAMTVNRHWLFFRETII